jgi:hypothetical protein
MRETRIAAQRQVEAMKGTEKELQAKIMEALEKQDAQKASGKHATASLTESEVPKVEDWNKFYAYVHKNKAFELLHRRIAITAWQERADAKVKIPGVTSMKVQDLSLTKSGG